MTNLKFSQIAITIICVLGLFLRVYNIDKVPVSLYWDEVAAGYNAYSIDQTGKDEYGSKLPLLFKSFNDYKAPGNIYLTAIFIKFLGLNEFSVRLPSAFLGSLSVLLLYLLTKEFTRICLETRKKPIPLLDKYHSYIPLLAAFLMSISPWHLQFSRVGFEANDSLFLLLLAVLLFFYSLRKGKWLLLVSCITFALRIYFYRSALIVSPLMLTGLFIIFRHQLFAKNFRLISIISLILYIIIALPIVSSLFTPGGEKRADQVSFIHNFEKVENDSAKFRNKLGNSLISKVIFNRRLTPIYALTENYLSYFDPLYLFKNGDGNGRHGVRGMGPLYLWSAPFILLGLFVLLKLDPKIRNIILLWLLIAPIPASLALPSPHNLRSLNIVPMYQVLTALGILFALVIVPKVARKITILSITIVIILFFTNYLHSYYVVTPKFTSDDWGDGYKQLVTYVDSHYNGYNKILISGHYWQPYIYFLFFNKYDPVKYQKNGSSKGFDKFVFGGTSWDREQYSMEFDKIDLVPYARLKPVLLALSPEEFNAHKNIVLEKDKIKNTNGKTIFIIAELK